MLALRASECLFGLGLWRNNVAIGVRSVWPFEVEGGPSTLSWPRDLSALLGPNLAQASFTDDGQTK